MGYFSNGTEGMSYVESYCFRCVHWKDLDDGRGAGCPVWDLHLLHNYKRETEVARMLDTLIPRATMVADDGIDLPYNEQCTMFHERV
jgi:hypothetical protein